MVLIHVRAKRPQSLDPLHGGGPQEIRMRMKCEMGWPRRRLEEGLKANIGIPKRSRVLYDVVCSRIPSFPGEQFVKPFVADAETIKDMGIEEDARLSVEFIQAQVEKKKRRISGPLLKHILQYVERDSTGLRKTNTTKVALTMLRRL